MFGVQRIHNFEQHFPENFCHSEPATNGITGHVEFDLGGLSGNPMIQELPYCWRHALGGA